MSFLFKSQDYEMGYFDYFGGSPSPPPPLPIEPKTGTTDTKEKKKLDLIKSRDDYDFLGCMSDGDDDDNDHSPLPGCSPHPFMLKMNGTTDSNTDRTVSSAVSTVMGRTTTNSSIEGSANKLRELQCQEEKRSPICSPKGATIVEVNASKDSYNNDNSNNGVKSDTPSVSAPASPLPTTSFTAVNKDRSGKKTSTPKIGTPNQSNHNNNNNNAVGKLSTPDTSAPASPSPPPIASARAVDLPTDSKLPVMSNSPKRQVLPSVWHGRGAPAPKTVEAAATSPKTVRMISMHYKNVFASNPNQSGDRYKKSPPRARRTVKSSSHNKKYNDEISLSSIPLPLERNNDSSLFIQLKEEKE